MPSRLTAFVLVASISVVAVSAAPAHLRRGDYECWSGSRAQGGLNFKILDDSRYEDVEGALAAYTFDPGSGRLQFKGGAHDGSRAKYHEPGGVATVSFRNASDAEIAFCEAAAR